MRGSPTPRHRASRLGALVATLLIGGLATPAPSPACEAMLGKEYVEPPEVVAIDLDPARWQVATRSRDEQLARKEYVLAAETLADWSELVSWQVDFAAVHADVSALQAEYLARLGARCSSLHSKQIRSTPDARILEWWHSGCYGQPPQHEISRWIAGETGTHQLSYGVRGRRLRGAERARWIERLATAQLRSRLAGREPNDVDRARRHIWAREYDSAVALLRPLAESGSSDAQDELGRLHVEGWGVERDPAQALRWFERAAVQHNAAALYDLGRMYEKGMGVVSDRGRALEWFRQAAEAGDAEAQGHLGFLALTSEIPDYATARRWFERSAAAGHVDALHWMGRLLEEGWAIEPDAALAAAKYREAAVQGSADAQYRLGRLYASGAGVPQSDTESIKWLRRAAMQGQPEARAFYLYRFPAPKTDASLSSPATD